MILKLLALLLGLIGCAGAAGAATVASDLYARLGGDVGVRAISSALIDRVAADPAHGTSFKDTNLAKIKQLLSEQLCELSGGPCHYSGTPMKEAHAGLRITQADFYDMVETLRAILRERHVDQGAINELLRLLAPMKRDVVDSTRAAAP